ncbi:hypothetical protein KY326_04820 [Candidatus Woesearchaeota archaeon]|nr:hypothetical protein [Candidatus Woesearchaeota archaeon]
MELDIDQVLIELNSKDKEFEFVRIENQWEEDGKEIYKVVVKDTRVERNGYENWYFVEVTVDDSEIDVGDLEDYDVENDMWE